MPTLGRRRAGGWTAKQTGVSLAELMSGVDEEKGMLVRPVPKQAFLLVAAAAFTSGALAIAVEMTLMRLAARYTGSAADGTTTALSLYLLGLLAGAALVLRLNNKNGDNVSYLPPVMLILLALWGAGLGYLSKLKAGILGLEQLGGGLPLCTVLILVPACLAGTIFPLLLILCTRFYFGSRESFIECGGEVKNFNNNVILLYLISNLGSALGALASAIWLLPGLGIAQSFYCVASGWICVALLLAPFVVATSSGRRGSGSKVDGMKGQANEAKEAKEIANEAKETQPSVLAPSEPVEETDEGESINAADAVVTSSLPFTYVSVFFAALAGLVFECLAIRLLALLGGASFITTACAVAATLLAITLGTRISLFLPAHKNTRLTLSLALCLAASGVALTVVLLPHLNNVFQAVRHLTFAELSEADRHSRWLAYFYPRLILALIFCLPGATGLSLIFPVAARSASRPFDMLRLYIAGGLGTALAPLVFITCIGRTLPAIPSSIELMLRIMVILLVALAVAALRDRAFAGKKAGESIFTKILCLGATASAVAVLFFVRPLNVGKIDMGLTFVSPKLSVADVEQDGGSNLRLFYKEGRTATVSVLADQQANRESLRSDGKVEGAVPINLDSPAIGSDLPTQSLLALLPLIWREPKESESKSTRDCFLIGYGTGTTAATIVQAAPTLNLRVAEIEPAVVQAGKYFQHNSELVRPASITTGDARHILQGSPTSFDFIISQPAEPWVQGSTNLYSSQFYRLVRSRLNSGGTFCQWLQLYGMDERGLASALTTFHMIFPHCLVFHPHGAGEVIVLGFNCEREANLRSVRQNFLLPANRKLLARAGIDSFEALRGQVLLDSDGLSRAVKEWHSTEGAIQVSDDNLALEFDSVPEIENASRSIQANLSLLRKWTPSGATGSMAGRHPAPADQATFDGNGGAAEKAWALSDQGDDEGALRLVQDSLNRDPYCVSAINVQALLALRQGYLPRAQESISKSLDLNPNKSFSHQLASLSWLFQGNTAQAIKEADLAHRINQLDYRPYLLAAAAYHVAGDNGEALAKLKRARQICPNGVILKQVDSLAGEFSRPIPTLESMTYSGTLASRLTRLLRGFSSSISGMCNHVL
jgi:tetratricopeptide (TPR) repeat protein